MSIDFTKLAVGGLAPLISPRDIFAALPGRAAGFGYLRDVQGQVLDAWDVVGFEMAVPRLRLAGW